MLEHGIKLLLFYSLFDKNHSYLNYKDSFHNTLQKAINCIKETNIFDSIKITVRYVNKIKIDLELENPFHLEKYHNINGWYK